MLCFNSHIFRKAIERASQNQKVVEILGEPIVRGPWYDASLAVGHRRHSVSCTFPVTGPLGSGTFQLKAIRNGGSCLIIPLLHFLLINFFFFFPLIKIYYGQLYVWIGFQIKLFSGELVCVNPMLFETSVHCLSVSFNPHYVFSFRQFLCVFQEGFLSKWCETYLFLTHHFTLPLFLLTHACT